MPRTLTIVFGCSVAIIGVFIIAIGLAAAFGRGGRGEFSPDSLETRTQSEWLVPWVEIPVYRSDFRYGRSDLVEYLIDHGYWMPVDRDPVRWRFAYHVNQLWRDGQSQFYKEIAWGRDGWIAWTEAHPEIARNVWPRVIDMLRSGGAGDSQLTQFMRLAKHSTSLDEFEFFLAATLPNLNARNDATLNEEPH